MAPFRTFFGRRGEEDFEGGIGEYLGAHIPAIRDQSWGLSECPLATQQRVPDRLKGGYGRSSGARIFGTDSRRNVFPIENDLFATHRIAVKMHIEIACELSQPLFVIQRYTFTPGVQTDEPVQGPAVKQMPTKGHRYAS
jgi:hypothetical protein